MYTSFDDILGILLYVNQLNQFIFEHLQPLLVVWLLFLLQLLHHPDTLVVIL